MQRARSNIASCVSASLSIYTLEIEVIVLLAVVFRVCCTGGQAGVERSYRIPWRTRFANTLRRL